MINLPILIKNKDNVFSGSNKTSNENNKEKLNSNMINDIDYYDNCHLINNTDIIDDRKNNLYKERNLDETKKNKLSFEESQFNLYDDFNLYNRIFFEGKLNCVAVEWSLRMTLCAGTFQVKDNLPLIRLSEPLLKYRSIKDVKETLIHEMIHAYNYVENHDLSDDPTGHGKNFKKKMNEVNSNSEFNITVYHDYIDEVDFLRKHIWRCNGICMKKPPYFGYVKRAMNRPPGKNDVWWEQHQKNCGGQFTKIAEPENFNNKNKKKKNKENKDKDNTKNANFNRDKVEIEKGENKKKKNLSLNHKIDNFIENTDKNKFEKEGKEGKINRIKKDTVKGLEKVGNSNEILIKKGQFNDKVNVINDIKIKKDKYKDKINNNFIENTQFSIDRFLKSKENIPSDKKDVDEKSLSKINNKLELIKNKTKEKTLLRNDVNQEDLITCLQKNKKHKKKENLSYIKKNTNLPHNESYKKTIDFKSFFKINEKK